MATDRQPCPNATCPQGKVPGMDGIPYCAYEAYRINQAHPRDFETAGQTIGRHCPFAADVRGRGQRNPPRTS